MSELIKDTIKKNKPHFLKYKKYINENDWQSFSWDGIGKTKTDVELRKSEFDVQNQLVIAMLERTKAFVKRSDGDHHLKVFKDFIKESLNIIKIHTDRADGYISFSDISKIADTDLRASEIAFHNHLYKAVSSIEDTVSALNIKEDQAAEGIQWLDNQKATIAMHKNLVKLYPEIQKKLDSLKIDFNSLPPSNIHILNPKPPIYNSEKNYWEQDSKTLQYFIDEYKKIDYGVTIDDYYISGELYYHFNYFVTKIPKTVVKAGFLENEDEIVVPQLRDNEIVISEYLQKARKEEKKAFIAASRRIAKTTFNASKLTRAQILGKEQILCAGGSSEDLGHISNNIATANYNINPAFRLYYLSLTKNKKGSSYGIKTKSNKSIVTTNIYIVNLEGGNQKDKKESLAGFTPDEFILDEAMKFKFKSQLDAIEPALWAKGIMRCFPIITGTGGDDKLAVDAINMLNNPTSYDVCIMDWNLLERNVPKEFITWERRDFGLFLPTQMSIKHEKTESNLADYLGIKGETLSKIPIWVTDWKKSKENEDIKRALTIKDKVEYVRLLAYHPYDPNEIFLSGNLSPFHNVVEEAKQHRNYLMETGQWDKRRTLVRDKNGKITAEISTKDLISFPFIGLNQYAPYLIIEEPDNEKNSKYYYLASGDFYKQQTSTSTDSVCTIIVYKFPIFGDISGKKIVATFASRPNKFKELNESILLLLEYYNAVLFPENEDLQSFQAFLEERHLENDYLEKHIDFGSAMVYSDSPARKFGYTPRQSNSVLLPMYANYLDENVTVLDDGGKEKIIKRVQTVDDIWMLSEIINFTENGNHDRISGALGGIGLIHFLLKHYIYPKGTNRKKQEEQETNILKEPRKLQHYNPTRGRTFFKGLR